MNGTLRVALIAHDACKQDMLEWSRWNVEFLSRLEVWATRHTGGELDMVVFFWDPLATHAHAPDVQGLIRLAVVHNVAIACNRRSADLMMSSRLLDATAV